MAEGFCFAEKKPPRPGQFSERPKPEQPQAADTSQFIPMPKNIPAEHSPLSPLHAPVHIHRPAIPLDLPELGLTGNLLHETALVKHQSSVSIALGSLMRIHRKLLI
ncbi:hypothetical protein LB505_006341 [Fusarium chuoi]|nr:hypothetical protein LB505_006341 [Fusarium chuoi]